MNGRKFRFGRAEYVLDVMLSKLVDSLVRWRARRVGGRALPRLWLEPGDYVSQCILATGLYEKYPCQALWELLQDRERDVFLDVGANLGNHTTFFAPAFRRVLAFEPNRLTRQALELNLAHNGLAHVEVFGLGLSDRPGTLAYEERRDGNLGGSRFHPSGALQAPVERGDDVLARCLTPQCRVSFVKIDVEGHELEALHGLQETLRRHHPLIAFEVSGASHGESLRGCLGETYALYDLVPAHVSRWGKLATLGRLSVRGPALQLRAITHFTDRFYPLVVAVPQGTPRAR